MAYREERINEFLNSRFMMVIMGIVYAVVSYFAFTSGLFNASMDSGNGVFFNDADIVLSPPLVSFGVNTACVFAIVALTILLNKTYTFIREVTYIYGATFMILQLACPYGCTQFSTGVGLCLLTLVVQLLMFSTYQRKQVSQQRVFLVFFLVALCSLFQYAFLALIVPFFIGFAQMRAINFRGVLAALFGLATPFWLAIGLGLIDPTTAMLPTFGSAMDVLQEQEIPVLLVGLIVLALLTFVLIVMNVLKIMSYRLQLRVYNSFYLVLALFSIVMMGIDYRNFIVYLPLLNYCFAIQVAQAFTIHTNVTRRYVLLILVLLACAAAHASYYFL